MNARVRASEGARGLCPVVRAAVLLIMIASLASAPACKREPEGTATEVIVELDADSTVAELAQRLEVEIEGGRGVNELAGRVVRNHFDVEPIRFPKRVALVPARAATPRAFVLTATVYDREGAFVAGARLIGGYVDGSLRYARLEIQGGDCLRKSCTGARETCSAGSCVEASTNVAKLSSDGRHPTLVQFPPQVSNMDAGRDDSGAANLEGGATEMKDAGGPSDAGDAGEHADAGDAGERSDGGMTAPADSGKTTPAEAGAGDAGPATEAVFEVGKACSKRGELGCADHDSTATLVCSGGIWTASTACDSNARCDTRLGATQGRCLALVPECGDKAAGDAFCRGNSRMHCGVDRVSAETDETCQSDRVCVLDRGTTACTPDVDECALNTDDCDDAPDACVNTFGSYRCQCPSGYQGLGQGPSGCVDIVECSTSNGGCDTSPMATCHEVVGGPSTCICPPPYVGNGTGSEGCLPPDYCLENITDYTSDGPFSVQTATAGSIYFWVPSVPEGCKVPVVHFANGSGGSCTTYAAIVQRLATHGFLSVCYDNAHTGAGEFGLMALETALTTYPNLADKKLGSAGHNEGGQGAIVTLQLAEDHFGTSAIYAGLSMEPASGFGSQPAGGTWQQVYAKVKSPVFIFSGSADQLTSESWVQQAYDNLSSETYWFSAVGADSIPPPLSWTQEAAVPWFRWKLLGDSQACAFFKALPDGSRWDPRMSKNEQPCP